MESKKNEKLKQALKQLEEAVDFYKQGEGAEDLKFLALSKSFEVAVEYAWKGLKNIVEEEGLEALSPKDAIRHAAKLNLIQEAHEWIDYINVRNLGIHDYYGIPKKDYFKKACRFLEEAKPLFLSLD